MGVCRVGGGVGRGELRKEGGGGHQLPDCNNEDIESKFTIIIKIIFIFIIILFIFIFIIFILIFIFMFIFLFVKMIIQP